MHAPNFLPVGLQDADMAARSDEGCSVRPERTDVESLTVTWRAQKRRGDVPDPAAPGRRLGARKGMNTRST